jgi:signal transduction histidine kinase
MTDEFGDDPHVAPEQLPAPDRGAVGTDGPQSGTDEAAADGQERATLSALHDVSRTLVDADDRSEVSKIAVAAARDVIGLPLSGIHLDDGSGDLVPVAVTEGVTELYDEIPAITDVENPAYRAYAEEEPLLIGEHDEFASVRLEGFAANSGLLAPLPDHGVFLMNSPEEREFSEDELSFALTLAANTRAALDASRREQALQRQNERLETFTAVVSHDLRNPLTMLEGNLELARETGEDEYFEKASEAVDRMDELIESVLVLARYGEAIDDPEWVVPERVAWDAWSECPDGGSLAVDLPADRLLAADPDRLRQLLSNCFRNALEHGGEDPAITVGIDDDVLYVADDGPGIPPEERDRVFEYGYSNAAGGTGLGLKIVDELAAAHGWDASVTESEDGGVRVELSGVEIRPASS